MNPLNRITQRIALLGRHIEEKQRPTISVEAFNRDDHQPDGTVKGKVLAIKPPLGVMPRHLWVEARMRDLAEAARLHAEAGQCVPEDIVHELMDHSAALELGKRLKPTPDPITIEQAMRRIGQALFEDDGYALGWHANLAMAAHDAILRDPSKLPLAPAERTAIADLILERFFGLPPLRNVLRGNELDVGEPAWRTGADVDTQRTRPPVSNLNSPEALENPETWTAADLLRELEGDQPKPVPAVFNRIRQSVNWQVRRAGTEVWTEGSAVGGYWLVSFPWPRGMSSEAVARQALQHWITGIEDTAPVTRVSAAQSRVEVKLRQNLRPRCHLERAEVTWRFDDLTPVHVGVDFARDEASAVEGTGVLAAREHAAQQDALNRAATDLHAAGATLHARVGASLNSKAAAQSPQAAGNGAAGPL